MKGCNMPTDPCEFEQDWTYGLWDGLPTGNDDFGPSHSPIRPKYPKDRVANSRIRKDKRR